MLKAKLVGLIYKTTLLSYLLWPASVLYSLIAGFSRNNYFNNTNKQFRPQTKVISIGNIVSGGSGKTPFTIYLAELLKKNDFKVAISHRGYKGKLEDSITQISDRNKSKLLPCDPSEIGDEPLLYLDQLQGIPVIVGKNRKQAIKSLETKYGDLDFILLDDSFQHHKVKHDHDFVLFKELSGEVNSFVLPAGPLRESPKALKFADTIVVVGQGKSWQQIISKHHKKPVIKGQFMVKGIFDRHDNRVSLESIRQKRIALISAIGRPESFHNTVNKLGISVIKHYIMPDHYSYSQPIEKIIGDDYDDIDLLLTTEKDWPKIKQYSEKVDICRLKIRFYTPDEELLLEIIKSI